MKNNRIVVKDLGILSYEDSWEHQKKIFDNIISQKIKNRTLNKKNKTDNYLLIVEHKPIFTIGKSGDTSNLLLDTKQLKSNGVDAFALKLLDDIKYRREEDIKYLLKLKGEFNSGTQSIKESTD